VVARSLLDAVGGGRRWRVVGRPRHPMTWTHILAALKQLGSTSPTVRPGLHERVCHRLFADEPPPTGASAPGAPEVQLPPEHAGQESSVGPPAP
jgi:hypothetical protein